jgi:hypothetical protein
MTIPGEMARVTEIAALRKLGLSLALTLDTGKPLVIHKSALPRLGEKSSRISTQDPKAERRPEEHELLKGTDEIKRGHSL